MTVAPGHRPRKTTVFIVFNLVLALTTLAAGSGLLYANWKLGSRKVIAIERPVIEQEEGGINLTLEDDSPRNYLVTGADNYTCDDLNTKGIGKRDYMGARSDSLLVIRVDPRTKAVAMLSFPRDLWVRIGNGTNKGRINGAYDSKNPNLLIRTIKANFGIDIDHYVSVDLCAFKHIVDAVGGVRVNFRFKARDNSSLFRVDQQNVCLLLDGETALRYVRSRKYQWFNPAPGAWESDGGADYGRIARQQDFIKRVMKKSLAEARTNPRTAANILSAGLNNVITDDRMTPMMLLELADAMRDYDANATGSYTFPGTGKSVDNRSVIEPDFNSPTAKAIMAVFQGKASVIAPTGTGTTVPGSTTATNKPTASTLPTVTIEQKERGIVPPNDPNCQY
jgi:LCP family protein required for cell wall assembly